MNTKKSVKVTCVHCNYTWNYKGRLKNPTCPSCHRNTPLKTLHYPSELVGLEGYKDMIDSVKKRRAPQNLTELMQHMQGKKKKGKIKKWTVK